MDLEPKSSKGNMLGVPEFGVLSNRLELVFDVLFLKSFILFFHLHKTCFHAQLSINLIVYANEKIKYY